MKRAAGAPGAIRHHRGERVTAVFSGMLALFAYLAGTLVHVQAGQGPRLAELAMAEHVGMVPLQGLRGAILDRHGHVLAASVARRSIAANPRLIANRATTALVLSGALEVPERRMRALLASSRTFVWLARKVPDRIAARVERLKIDGVFALREDSGVRVHPRGPVALHVLGYTGIDDNGLDGIESAFDGVLRGAPGRLEAEMEQNGDMIAGGWIRREAARPGETVVLTIDERIQAVAQDALAQAVRRHRARGGVCIVMDADNGDILALANHPDLSLDPVRSAASPRNRAISDSYEPGSTFKVFLAAAALDSGKVGMPDLFYCGDHIQVEGWTIHNADDGEASPTGTDTLEGILTHSYNVGTAAVALRLGRRTWFEYIDRFGFGRRTGLPVPGEAEGIVPPLALWRDITVATTSFGQGVAVTPIQLCSAMQAVAGGGMRFRPRLVMRLLNAQGDLVRAFPERPLGRAIERRTAARLRAILRNVVAHGTGGQAEVPGYPVAGKTGTAQVVDGGRYAPGRYHASFLGFAPVHAPRVVVLVKIEEPRGVYWGGTVAAPVFRAVTGAALRLLGVPPAAPSALPLDDEADMKLAARPGKRVARPQRLPGRD